jgi:hypothetical protein
VGFHSQEISESHAEQREAADLQQIASSDVRMIAAAATSAMHDEPPADTSVRFDVWEYSSQPGYREGDLKARQSHRLDRFEISPAVADDGL